jgi:TRAP-type C4-dicarboxylate transport system substrate-binding protein
MTEKTGGRWEIEIHGGGVLAPAKDTIDGIKAGMFQMGLISSMYIPGKIPLRTVTQNPFLAPPTLAGAGEWVEAVSNHPAVVKQVDAWNAKVLFSYAVAPYEYMGKKPFKKVEDLKGLRIRIDPIGGAPFEAHGAVITMMAGPEIYTALERGLLDGVSFIWPYTFGIYKLNELSQYVTLGIGQQVSDMWVAINKDDWNALPDEWKKLAEESAAKTTERYVEYRKNFDAKWLKMFDEQGLEITTLAPEERAKLVAKAEISWEKWVKEMEAKGVPGQELLDFAISKRDEIMAR